MLRTKENIEFYPHNCPLRVNVLLRSCVKYEISFFIYFFQYMFICALYPQHSQIRHCVSVSCREVTPVDLAS